MSINIRFEKEKSGIAHYFVSINGFPEVACGPGAQGLSNATGILSYVKLLEGTKVAINRGLENLTTLSKQEGSILLQRHEDKLEAKVFSDSSELKTQDILDLANSLQATSVSPAF